MANMRVHELAKELNISSKDIAQLLSNKDKEYKAASGLSDDEISRVRTKYGKGGAAAGRTAEKAPAARPAEKTEKAESKPADKEAADPEKKHKIAALFFPQNSSKKHTFSGNSDRNGHTAGHGNGNGSAQHTAGRTQETARPAAHTAAKPAAQPETRAAAPARTEAVKPAARKETEQPDAHQAAPAPQKTAAPAQEKPVVKPAEQPKSAEQPKTAVSSEKNGAAQSESRTPERRAGNDTQSSNRESRSEGGYNNNRSEGGYNNNRNNGGYNNNCSNGGYNNNRSNGGYNNNRSNGGYNNNRSEGGYNNNRSNGGYNNNRSEGGYNNNRSEGGYNNNRSNGGYNNNRSEGGYNNNRSNGGGYNNNRSNGGYNSNGGGYNNNRSNGGGYNSNGGGYNNNRSNGGGYNNNRSNGGGYNSNRSNGGGYNSNRSNGGGYNNNRSNGGGYNNNRGGYNNRGTNGAFGGGGRGNAQGGRRNERGSAGENEFMFEKKPDARDITRSSRKDSHADKRKEEEKENLKFVNSNYQKKREQQKEKEEDTIKQLVLPDYLTIKELADKMKIQPSVIVKKLFLEGKVATINQEIDYDTAEEIALGFDCLCEHEKKVDVIAELLKEDEENEGTMVPRPPVVCVMGHVDHGKTSLLDAIRSTHVTDRESGGITQKIGAYTVKTKSGRKITFLDTPGHEAFTAMRMRGAQSTDIAILVVAADDGVMPQTIEAINHAKAAGVEIIVAVNKIDKPNANVEKVKQELTEYELIPEDWGGSTVFCPVSAHTGEGIDDLLEMIMLTADVMELKANPDREARGIVIEAELDKGRGSVATVLVQKGTLHVGDNVAAGSCHGKIRAMIDDKGKRVKEAGPSVPVEILGLNDVPNAGEILVAFESDKEARSFAETFISEGRKKLLDDTRHKLSLDDLFEQIKAGNVKELDLIVKADVQGSVEAVKQSLVKLSNEEVVVKIIHGGVGNINESDVILASASNAIIIGFNVKPDNQARIAADRENVDIRLYSVIYNAIEDVEAALKGMLEPIYEEQVMGHAEIKQIFKASGIGNIAGAMVMDGKITSKSTARISRDGKQIFEGKIATLKRFKDEVKEVKAGSECGLVFENFNDIQEEDKIEAYEMVEVPR